MFLNIHTHNHASVLSKNTTKDNKSTQISQSSTHRKLHNITFLVTWQFEAGQRGHHHDLVFVGGAHQAGDLPVAGDWQVYTCVLVFKFPG